MKKISTLFKKDPNDLSRVVNEIDPENDWVEEYGIPTVKFDGTSCAIIDGVLYKRYDSKINKKTGKRKPVPNSAIPCQAADETTGHWPHWITVDPVDPSNKYHIIGIESLLLECGEVEDGTYELCGKKIQGNPEKIDGYVLIKHGEDVCTDLFNFSFDSIKDYLSKNDIEGIVFHHRLDERMCKIRKTDFGIKR